MASEYVDKDGKYIPVGGKADLVDGKVLKPDCWYIVEGGKWVEVDFTDGVFSYVLSNKKGIKKVKTEKGETLYIVSDDNGNSAHGKTIAEARADLIYKAIAREDVEIPKQATGAEWCAIYRAVTGACSAGVRAFVEESGKNINESYTVEEISALVQGKYNAQLFYDRINQQGRNVGKWK